MATLLLAVLVLSYMGIFGFLARISFKLFVIKETELQIKVAQLQIIQAFAEQYEVVARAEWRDACQESS